MAGFGEEVGDGTEGHGNWLGVATKEDANPTQTLRLDRRGRMRHKLPRRLPRAVTSGKSKARTEPAMGTMRKGHGSQGMGFHMRRLPADSSLWEARGRGGGIRGSLWWVGAMRSLDKQSV